MHSINKQLTAREIHHVFQCHEYNYRRILKLVGNRDTVNLSDILSSELPDVDKVLAIERLQFLDRSVMRILALRHARATIASLDKFLSDEAKKLATRAIEILSRFYMGEADLEELTDSRNEIKAYLKREFYSKKNVPMLKEQAGAMEILLAVSKQSALGALRETSSIQRDILGDAISTQQLNTMKLLIVNFYDVSD